jgi:phenylalanyl-tRNA synthetase beta chain
MTTEHEFLRSSMRPSSLQVAAYNYRRQSRTLRLFESGRTFFGRPGDLPLEKEMLVGLLGGERWDGTWIGEKGRLGFFDAKGVMELLFGKLGLSVSFSPAESYWMVSGRTAEIRLVGAENTVLGVVGEISRGALDSYGLDLDTLAMFEIDLDVVYESTLVHGDVALFDSFSRTPGVYRDLSLLAAKNHSSGAIREILENHPLVVSATLFDLYEDEGNDDTQRVLGYRLLFQSVDNTLTTEEVSQAESEILKTLESQLDISLRS